MLFVPSTSWPARILLGRYQHVAAFTYVPGFRAWIVYDVQWSGMRLAWFAHQTALAAFIHATRGCAIVKFTRRHGHLGLASRLGFYCVPAIKQLLGLSCVAATPDALYRHLMNNGGIRIDEPKRTTTATTGSDAASRARASAG